GCRSDRKATEGGLQRFEEALTKLAAGGNREVGIVGQVWHTGHRRNLAVQKIAHEKGLRQPNAPKCLSASNGSGCFHRWFDELPLTARSRHARNRLVYPLDDFDN